MSLYFAEESQHFWREVAERIMDAVFALSLVGTEAIESVSIEKGVRT